MRSLALSLILAPSVLAPAPVSAQETQATAAARFSREFARSDLDKNGVLTRQEVSARMGRMKAGEKKMDDVHVKRLTDLWFGRADLDKNGEVTEAEGQALLVAIFKRYDKNGDGKLGGPAAAAPKAAEPKATSTPGPTPGR